MRYRVQAVCLAAAVLLVLTLSGCSIPGILTGSGSSSSADAAISAYSVYYMDKQENRLYQTGYQLASTTADGIIEECLSVLSAPPEDEAYRAVLEDPVQVDSYTYDKEQRTLTLHFNSAYAQLSKTRELLVRSAVVKTLTQFGGIVDYVAFYIGDTPLTDDAGNVLMMQQEDYVTEITRSLNNLISGELVLYYASEDGEQLKPEVISVKYYTTASVESIILEALISGPAQSSLNPVLSPETRVNRLYVKDGICYVDFNRKFLESVDGQSVALNIYAVVNSLTELSDISEVQLLIDGECWTEKVDGISIEGMLGRDISYVDAETVSESAAETKTE